MEQLPVHRLAKVWRERKGRDEEPSWWALGVVGALIVAGLFALPYMPFP